MDKKRIIVGLSMAAVIITAVVLVPSGNIVALLGLLAVCGLAMREIYALMALGGWPASKKMGMISGLFFVGMTWWVSTKPGCIGCGISYDVLWGFLLIILLINFCRLFGCADPRKAIQNLLGTLFGFIYVAFFWSFFVRLYVDGNPHEPARAAFYLLLAVKWGDAGAYFIGSKFGKHRLAPVISPKKSWEGLLGGILFSCVVGILWWAISGGTLGSHDFPLYHALILGIVLPIIGTIGDLVESMFKRAADVKDSGALAHGVGGMLDMIDSLLFTAPFLYIYIQFILPR